MFGWARWLQSRITITYDVNPPDSSCVYFGYGGPQELQESKCWHIDSSKLLTTLTVFAVVFALGFQCLSGPDTQTNNNNGHPGRKTDDPDGSHDRRKQWD